MELFVGGDTETGGTNLALGAEYERRITPHWGAKAVVEHVDYLDAWIFLAPVTFRPWPERGLKLYAGPGFEIKERELETEEISAAAESAELDAEPRSDDGRETLFVMRTGISWTFTPHSLLVTPQIEADLLREAGEWETALVFGISAGFDF